MKPFEEHITEMSSCFQQGAKALNHMLKDGVIAFPWHWLSSVFQQCRYGEQLLTNFHQSQGRTEDIVTKYGMFEHVYMDFGLCNILATFPFAVGSVLQGLMYNQALPYLDDVVIFGWTFLEHQANLDMISRLGSAIFFHGQTEKGD